MQKKNRVQRSFLAAMMAGSFVVLVWLIITPSLGENPLVLSYSSARVGMIVLVFSVVISLGAALLGAASRFTQKLTEWALRSKLACFTSAICGLGAAISLFGFLGKWSLLISRLLPVLLWVFFLAGMVLIFQQATHKGLLLQTGRACVQTIKSLIEGMNERFSSRLWKWAVLGLLVLVFAHLIYTAMTQLLVPVTDQWRVADWLINYQGGLVRRGLMGEAVYQLSSLTAIRSMILIVVLQLIVYAILLLSVLNLAKTSAYSAAGMMILFSPAFLLFTVYNPLGAFRKEILWLALLAGECVYLLNRKRPVGWGHYVFISLAAMVLVSSHEMLVVYLPYLACATLIRERKLNANILKTLLALLPAGLVVGAILLLGEASRNVVAGICRSLAELAPPECQIRGAIASLSQTFASAHQMVLARITTQEVKLYVSTALLGALPVTIFAFSNHFRNFFSTKNAQTWFLVFILVSLLGSLPIFWVAVDFGRFVYIHIVCQSLLVLMMNQQALIKSERFSITHGIYLIIGLIFVFSWRLIYAGITLEGVFPWLG